MVICCLEIFYALFGTTLDKIKKKTLFTVSYEKNISSKKIGENVNFCVLIFQYNILICYTV